jgi:hypothetical protein
MWRQTMLQKAAKMLKRTSVLMLTDVTQNHLLPARIAISFTGEERKVDVREF